MKAAAIQMNTTRDRDRNLATAGRLVAEAASAGAELVVLPEKWPWIARDEGIRDGAEELGGPAMTAARSWAHDLGIHLVAGSVTEVREDGRLTNTSPSIGPDGEIIALYRKVHMFDAEVDGIEYRESAFEEPGDEVVVFPLGEAMVGLAICYDIRFPELFTALAQRGATVVCLPSAFTPKTGRDHWEVLVRARAIENQCFVVAADQFGEAEPGFGFWGHSLIADPWGREICGIDEGEGYVIARLDFDELHRVRTDLPALEHRRPDLFPIASEGAA